VIPKVSLCWAATVIGVGVYGTVKMIGNGYRMYCGVLKEEYEDAFGMKPPASLPISEMRTQLSNQRRLHQLASQRTLLS